MKPGFSAPTTMIGRPLLILSLLLTGWTGLLADDEKLYLEWSSVPSAKSYVVEIQNKDDGKTVLSETVSENRIELKLPPGEYKQRVGVVNKFNKISVWSDWRPYSIIPTARPVLESLEIKNKNSETGTQQIVLEGKNITARSDIFVSEGNRQIPVRKVEQSPDGKVLVTVDMNGDYRGDYRIHVENPGGRKASSSTKLEVDEDNSALILADSGGFLSFLTGEEKTKVQENPSSGPSGSETAENTDPGSKRRVSRYSLLMPGLYAMQEGSTFRGAAWMSSFALYGAAAYAGYDMSSRAAAAAINDPIRNLYANQILYNQAKSLITTNEMEYYLLNTGYNSYQSQKSRYHQGKNIQAAAGAAAFATYIGHLYFENPEAWDWYTPIPGVSQFSADRNLAGGAIVATTALAVGALIAENQAAERVSNTIQNDIFYNYSSDPISNLFYKPLLSKIPADLVTLYSYQNYQAKKAEYNRHVDNQSRLVGLLVATYLYHLVDATIIQGTVVEGEGVKKEEKDTASRDRFEPSFSFAVIPMNENPMASFRVSLSF